VESQDEVGLYRATRARCPHGLSGGDLRIEGLGGRGCQVLVTVSRPDGTTARGLLDGDSPVFRVPSRVAPARVAPRYLALGIEHILTGPDHLAFVAALLLLVRTRRRLLATITAFTVGHSVTLAAASVGLLRVSPAPVEAAIALSILLVAYELGHPEHDTVTRRSPWLVAGAFGLLHGLGFAGALASVGLPRGDVALALLAFNAGVEAGQIVFVVSALAAAWVVQRATRFRPAAFSRVATYAIGALSTYWLLDRVAALAA
ncbi:MAG: HupE/UreJ family protein, partial [Deltaproteobacteria bacterium]